MDVERDQIDTEIDGGPKGGQRVLRKLIGVSAVTAKQHAATAKLCREALRMRDGHRPILRELSRDFYIHRHPQEISEAGVTPTTALARAGRFSHDPTQDPLAGYATAGAGAGDRLAGPLPVGRAASSLHTVDGQGARHPGPGAGRHQLQSAARRLPWARLQDGLQAAGGAAFPG